MFTRTNSDQIRASSGGVEISVIFARHGTSPWTHQRRGPYKAEVDLLIAPEARREDERDGVVAGLQNPIGGWRHAEADHMPRNRRERLGLQRHGYLRVLDEQTDQGLARDFSLDGVVEHSGSFRGKRRGVTRSTAIDDRSVGRIENSPCPSTECWEPAPPYAPSLA